MLEKSELNKIEVLIFQNLINSNTSHNEFTLTNNFRNSNDKKTFELYVKQFYNVAWSVKKNTESKNPIVVVTKIIITMPLSKCAVYGSKSLTFIKQQAARAL